MKRSLCEINHNLEKMELRFPLSPSDNQATRSFSPLGQSHHHRGGGSISKIRECPALHPPTEHTPVYTGEGGQQVLSKMSHLKERTLHVLFQLASCLKTSQNTFKKCSHKPMKQYEIKKVRN